SDITITMETPGEVVAGSEFEVQLTLKKVTLKLFPLSDGNTCRPNCH
ncbi:MAG: hypothetical protein HC906_13965, partial [Bacteroidales bacterium]|nr:hypothetical protein [Bacteroidales bacterium]